MLEKLFGLSAAGTTVRTEVMAGLATFLTMAYIHVDPIAILSTEGSGMGFGAVFTATIIAAVIGTLIMGLWANWPVALAPGMGLNAFFAFGVVFGMGYTDQQAQELTDKDTAEYTSGLGGYAEGGRIGYAEGNPDQKQMAMVEDMLKRGMDMDTIKTLTKLPRTPQNKVLINRLISQSTR